MKTKIALIRKAATGPAVASGILAIYGLTLVTKTLAGVAIV